VIFSIIDIETTGGKPKDSKITEIAIYKHDGEKVLDEYVTLVNPEMPIPPFISNLTGINDNMVQDAPKFSEIAKKIVEFTKDTVFVAHNVAFDYGIIRHEFKTLGFDYRLSHLCTVRASRHVLPGHDSYSLGKLTKALGIALVGRHRAGGDALATAKLFSILYKTDVAELTTFIQNEINPKHLHPKLNIDFIDDLPGKIGIYKFYNENNELIYIGKSKNIKKRIEQHLRNTKTNKAIKMQREIARIDFELCGSELIALIKESILIKKLQPLYNSALKRNKFPYGIFSYKDSNGYERLYVELNSKPSAQDPIYTFKSKIEATNFLHAKVTEFELCQKLCGLYKTSNHCFQYDIKQCKGACILEESALSYNQRIELFKANAHFSQKSFYIINNGRKKQEKSLVLISKGTFLGYGFAPFNFHKKEVEEWDTFIERHEEDRDIITIIQSYLRSDARFKIIPID